MTTNFRDRTAALALAALFALACHGLACSDGAEELPSSPQTAEPGSPPPAPTPEPEPPPADPAALAERGRAVYNANCVVCHNPDPSQDGGLGPAVRGSSRELLEARILRAEYPEGYTPKRDSRAMVALPHLETELDAIAAFLAE